MDIRLGGHAPRLVILTMLALIAALGALLALSETGHEQSTGLALRVSQVRDRQIQVSRLTQAVYEGESAMRGYLINGDPVFLRGVEEARARARELLDSLASNSPPQEPGARERAAGLRELADQRFAQFDRRIELHRMGGLDAVRNEVIPTDEGIQTMKRLRAETRQLEAEESDALVATLAQWLAHLRRVRLAMLGLTAVSVILVLIAGSIVYRQLRRDASKASQLQEQVRMSVNDLAALSSHLQYVSEREKKALARELHDALGGLLVATKMDVAWIRTHLDHVDPAIEQRFVRIQSSLDQGVDFKRRVVEQLRPTLLDNMGLFAALRWQFQDTCSRASLACHEQLPEQETELTSDAAIGLFRVAQEALTNILKHARASAAWLLVEVDDKELRMYVADNGRGMPAHASAGGGQGLAGMRHRVTALGGQIQIRPREHGGTVIAVRLPLVRVQAEPAQQGGDAPVSATRSARAGQEV